MSRFEVSNAKQIANVNASLASIAQWINVRDAQYGGVGDGVHDDTAAFQAAFNATSFTKRNVFIPEGNYVINGTIDLTGKSYLNVFCLGKILVGTNNIFNINNSSYNTYTGIYVQTQSGLNSNGSLYYIQGSSQYNTFINHKIQNLNSYAWIIDNSGTNQPIANTIDGVDCIYTNGLIKSITPSTVFGAEINIKRIRHDNFVSNLSSSTFPAFIWLRHTHDINLEDIVGVHQNGCLLIEGDCNINFSDFNLTGISLSTLKFTLVDSKPVAAVQLTNGLLWGVNGGINAQLERDHVTTFKSENVRIENSHIGILQGSQGDYFDDIIITDCDQFLAFNSNWTYTDITNLYFNGGKIGGTSLARTLMTSSVGLGVLQNLSIYFKNVQMRIAAGYSMADSPKYISFRYCDMDTTSYSQVRQKYVEINDDSNTAPVSGLLLQGQKLYYPNPTASGFIGQVCTTKGAFYGATWAASTAYSVGQWVINGLADNKVLMCTVAGTSGTTAPDPGTQGNTVTDGTVTWKYMDVAGTLKTFGAISA